MNDEELLQFFHLLKSLQTTIRYFSQRTKQLSEQTKNLENDVRTFKSYFQNLQPTINNIHSLLKLESDKEKK